MAQGQRRTEIKEDRSEGTREGLCGAVLVVNKPSEAKTLKLGGRTNDMDRAPKRPAGLILKRQKPALARDEKTIP